MRNSETETVSGATVKIHADTVGLDGTLSLPRPTRAVVIFAHGSGSSRLSPRNSYVARILEEAGLGTLLFDLLTSKEDQSYENRFNIDLLAERLASATGWLLTQPQVKGASLGYFGASTGAAAALQASIKRPEIHAIVSRGGRPDLAWDYLAKVKAPTLLIVGGNDQEVLRLNQEALKQLTVEKKLSVVPDASHLFEEPGTLEEVARIATAWFTKFL